MFSYQNKPWLTPVVIAVSLSIFLLDSFTPRGTADFIFYFIPVALSVLHFQRSFPFMVATLSTTLSVIGFYLSQEGLIRNELAFANRCFAIISMWVVAILVRRIIITRNEVNHHTWIRAQTVELIGRLRGEISTHELSTRLLSFMAQKLQYEVAALYLKQEESEAFSFEQGFAYTPDNVQDIHPGEGLLGQAIIDQKINYLSDLLPGHIKIKSSLGESNPQYIIIIPFIADNRTIGVAEMGFTSPPTEIIIDFLKEVNDSVAISIRSAQNKERLAQLLTRAQVHAEELQTQQEELRVVNEELEQQSRTLKESHLRLETQQFEMEQTNQQLEEQAQELEHQKSLLIKSNKELEIKSEEIKRSSNYKTEFLANMSHELRTPLNSTLILAKLLSENKTENLNPEQVEYAQIIYNSGNDLLNLINDILDLSKVEAGKMSVSNEVVIISQVIKSLEQTFGPVAKQKNLSFEITCDHLTPKDLVTDKLRLEQILKNFLSNAFKFTASGGVKLHLTVENNQLFFTVKDTGLGMAEDEQKIIFEAFRQADGTTNRKFGGTGLGLSISKELAQLLGGEITLISHKGKGSSFTLKLPLIDKRNNIANHEIISVEQKSSEENKKEKKSTSSPFTIKDDREDLSSFSRVMLIIEDDETFAKVLLDLAHEMSFAAIVCETAEEGMELAKKHRPNAIILDIRLPDHNGLIILDQLKLDINTRHIPVHVISAQDFSRSAREMGAMGYMLKPVKKEELQIAFQNMISLLEQGAKHVLIVEDDPIQRKHISTLIADHNVLVTTVETSAQALQLLSQKTFDCMIMDLALPDMSGHELLSTLSNDHSTYSFPPVIVYTARDLTHEEEQKLRLYSGSIIIKGAKSPERLLSEVTLFLHKVERELPPERQKMLRELRGREKNLEDRNILVVDDDVRNIFALTAALESHGAKIHSARNGHEALAKLSPQIDLILMDIMMPEMDGYQAITQIRLNETYKDIPIIALTAKAMKDDKQKCLDVGANDYLSKPLEVEKLLSLIKVWLQHQGSFL